MIDLNTLRGRGRASQRGFTLLELMIVLVVVTILTVLAISAYTEQVRKSRRANAYNLVGQLQLNLERWRAEHPCYASPANSSSYCSASYTSTDTYPTAPTDTYYTIAPAFSVGQPYYTVTATVISSSAQKNDRCGTLCVRSPGASASTTCGVGKPLWSNTACN